MTHQNNVSAILLILFSISAQAGLPDRAPAKCNPGITKNKPNSIYTDHLDGTVTDKQTGLMWQKCSTAQSWNPGDDSNNPYDDECFAHGNKETWFSALQSAADANSNKAFGYNDWRVPNIKELYSLVEKACADPAINDQIFPNNWITNTWSSTHKEGGKAWGVAFETGKLQINSRTSTAGWIRLVRDDLRFEQ